MANNKRKRIISQVDPKYISKDWREKKLRVAAYARVSTDSSDQENSLKNQLRHYEKFIPLHPQWEYVGTFSDDAVIMRPTRKNPAVRAFSPVWSYYFSAPKGQIQAKEGRILKSDKLSIGLAT